MTRWILLALGVVVVSTGITLSLQYLPAGVNVRIRTRTRQRRQGPVSPIFRRTYRRADQQDGSGIPRVGRETQQTYA